MPQAKIESQAETTGSAVEQISALLSGTSGQAAVPVLDEDDDGQGGDETLEAASETEGEASEVSEAPQAADAGEIHDISALAAAIGVEPEWLYNLKVPLADGREPITIGQIKDTIQETERQRELLSKHRADLEQRAQQIDAMLQVATEVPKAVADAQALVKSIEAEYARVDWKQLEARNPGKAALHRQKLNDAYAEATAGVQMAMQQASQVQQAQFLQTRNEEIGKFLEFVPEWKDKNTAVKERDEIVNLFAQRYGIHPRELLGLTDHRYVRAMRDFMLMARQVQGADAAQKRVVKAPKTLRPIANAATKKSAGVRNQEILNQRAKTLGTPRAQREAVANLFNLKGIF